MIELNNYLETARELWVLQRVWLSEICNEAIMNDLDPAAIAKAREDLTVIIKYKQKA